MVWHILSNRPLLHVLRLITNLKLGVMITWVNAIAALSTFIAIATCLEGIPIFLNMTLSMLIKLKQAVCMVVPRCIHYVILSNLVPIATEGAKAGMPRCALFAQW